MAINLPDIPLAIIGFAIFVRPLFSIPTGLKLKNYLEILLGVVIMGLTIYSVKSNSDDTEEIKKGVNDLIEKRKSDSTNSADFQRYLKDTFGIEKKGDKAIITNTVIYNSKTVNNTTLPQSTSDDLPDSLNYLINYKGDSIMISPQTGTWPNGFVALDTGKVARPSDVLYEGVSTINEVDKIQVDSKTYITHLWRLSDRPIFKKEPVCINLKAYGKNKFIIFGEQGNSNKRYLYIRGKVTWIPEK